MSDEDKREHKSDCAVYNEPAYPAGPCDCGAEPPTSNRKKLRQANLRIGRQREKITELLRTVADLRAQICDTQDRADAPELVALVDAVNRAYIPNEQQREAVQAALAAYEALK